MSIEEAISILKEGDDHDKVRGTYLVVSLWLRIKLKDKRQALSFDRATIRLFNTADVLRFWVGRDWRYRYTRDVNASFLHSIS
jgi:hypothetical protein